MSLVSANAKLARGLGSIVPIASNPKLYIQYSIHEKIRKNNNKKNLFSVA